MSVSMQCIVHRVELDDDGNIPDMVSLLGITQSPSDVNVSSSERDRRSVAKWLSRFSSSASHRSSSNDETSDIVFDLNSSDVIAMDRFMRANRSTATDMFTRVLGVNELAHWFLSDCITEIDISHEEAEYLISMNELLFAAAAPRMKFMSMLKPNDRNMFELLIYRMLPTCEAY